jgi:cellulose synthase/poly-beta-1,6-N-acetylglucosamine synthase-like glycosyltransferase
MDTIVSVIIRAYNSAQHIHYALNSVLHQTLPKKLYEVLVVDDGSVDNTNELVSSYGGAVKLLKSHHVGAVKAANIGFQHAMGAYVTLLDSDDVFEPTALEELKGSIEVNRGDVAYCDYYEKDAASGKTVVVSLQDNMFNCVAAGILVRRDVLVDLGGYDESLFFPEYDLIIKLMRKKKRFVYIQKPLFTYTRRPGSLTDDALQVARGREQLFKRHGEIKELRSY